MRASIIAYSIPVFFLLIGVEVLVARALGRRLYRFQDSVNSLSCGIAQQALGVGMKAATIGGYILVYDHLALASVDPNAWWVWAAGAIGVDLAYYWFHRASHRVGFLWAAHVVHHQSEEYNLTTALRQSALQGAVGAAFYWPLALLGLPPITFVMLSTINTLYQFWIHTRLIRKLGWLEWVFNTPSHHRVHHGIDRAYIDKNYAGILIVWDRLFGTFEEEGREPAYGTVKPLRSWNPIWANLEHWVRMWEMARASRRMRDRVWAFFAPPEWRPEELGGIARVPDVDPARELYARPDVAGLNGYVAVQLALVSLAIVRLLTAGPDVSVLELAALVAWIVVAVVAWGGLFESKRAAPALEVVRLLVSPLLVALGAGASHWAPWASGLTLLVAVGSSGWLLSLLRRAYAGAETA